MRRSLWTALVPVSSAGMWWSAWSLPRSSIRLREPRVRVIFRGSSTIFLRADSKLVAPASLAATNPSRK
jgi:hypothetical protein